MRTIGVGMIGMGGNGSWGHFPGYMEIPDEAKVVAMCDKAPGYMEAKARICGAKTYTRYEELLADPNVEVVDIILPHYLHAEVSLAAIEAGKHVIVEKPFTLTLDEADRVIAAARGKGVKLMVAENTRFVDAYEVTRKLLDEEAIGPVCYARTYIGGSELARMSDPNNWLGKKALAGGGVLMDAGVHSFYLLRWMVGPMTAVTAMTTTFVKGLPVDVEDNAVGDLRFENGALGHFSLTETSEHPWTERLELYGINGSLIVDMLSEHPVQLFSTKHRSKEVSKWWTHYGDVSWEQPFLWHSAFDWKARSMRKEVQHFVRCVAEDTQPLVSGEDGRAAVKMALKAYEAASAGREVKI